METKIYMSECGAPELTDIKEAAEILQCGGLVAFPTETVYGLGGNALDADAAKKIYAAKGRPSDNPLIIHISEPEDAEKYAYTNEIYYKIARAFMPGPITVILDKRECIPSSVTGGLDTVAVRCPSHETARLLIKECGFPIAAPSANLSGSPSPTLAEHVVSDLSGRIDAIIDGGPCEIGLESTIVKIDGDSLTLLRPGAVTVDALACICENVSVADAVTASLAENERPLSPGMKYRHYAPSAPLFLIDGGEEDVIRYFKEKQATEKCAVLCYDEEACLLDSHCLLPIGKRDDHAAQGASLFASLRIADSLGVEKIYAHLPSLDGLGLALYNRMIRAAAHTIIRI